MIHINLMEALIVGDIARIPAAEFCARGAQSEDQRFIYEIQVSETLTLVLDELQLIELVEKALDALPSMSDGEEWKGDAKT
jgi:hypothetical protein